MLRFTLVLALALAASAAAAQSDAPPSDAPPSDAPPSDAPPSDTAWRAQAEALRADQRTHLQRVLIWGGLNAAAGTALLLASSRTNDPARWGFGVQTAAWGTINTGIAVGGLLWGGGEPAASLAEALRMERGYAEVLLLNQGLNVGYAAVGTALWAAGARGVSSGEAWRGHGMALVVQGLGLFVLDGIAYLASVDRSRALYDVLSEVHLSAVPGGVGLIVVL